MDIGSINSQNVARTKENNKVQGRKDDAKSTYSSRNVKQSGDQLVISSEAQQISRIMARISSGYYNSPDVLCETAQRILNDISSNNE